MVDREEGEEVVVVEGVVEERVAEEHCHGRTPTNLPEEEEEEVREEDEDEEDHNQEAEESLLNHSHLLLHL